MGLHVETLKRCLEGKKGGVLCDNNKITCCSNSATPGRV